MSVDTDSSVANNQLLSADMRSRKLTDSELVLVDNTLYLDGAEIHAITGKFWIVNCSEQMDEHQKPLLIFQSFLRRHCTYIYIVLIR